MSIRKLKNNIDVLKMYDSIADLSGDVRYLEDQICEYDAFVSEKIGDLDYLSRSETHLARYSNNIDSKCDLIIAKLYTAS